MPDDMVHMDGYSFRMSEILKHCRPITGPVVVLGVRESTSTQDAMRESALETQILHRIEVEQWVPLGTLCVHVKAAASC